MQWQPIKNYEDLYAVSDTGLVKTLGKGTSNFSTKEKLLKPFLRGKYKYAAVRLYRNGDYKDFSVHRLVAEHFIENPLNLPSINHKDENRLNNDKNNLEWCTHQYNKEYSSSKYYKFKSPDGTTVEVFNLNKFCRENNLSNGSLYLVIVGKYRQHKGWSLL